MKRLQVTLRFRLFVIAVVAALMAGAFLLYTTRWRTTAELPLPYEEAETRLLSALNLNKDQLITSQSAPSDARGELAKSLTMGIHTQHLIDHMPGKRIHFWGDHKYDIGASGREWIEVDLTSKDDRTSSITVDYFENTWLLGIIPVTCQSGRTQEKHIIETIYDDQLAK